MALLVGLISDENWLKTGEILDQVRQWEDMCQFYKASTGKDVAEDIMIAMVLKHAPGEIGQHLRIQADAGITYPQLQQRIREYYVASRSWLPRPQASSSSSAAKDQPVPMDVGAITALQSAVNAIKGIKGKAGLKGKEGNKGKDGGGKKGKDGGKKG